MKNKQYPPRGGPPLVYRCRGIPGNGTRVGWRGFQTAHSFGQTAHSFPDDLHVYSLHTRDGTTNGVSLIPEGLHVYSQPVSRENSTPSGVAPSAYVWYYEHLKPPASSGPKLRRIRDDTGLYIRDDPDSYREDLHIRDGTGPPWSTRHGPVITNGRASPKTGRASPKAGQTLRKRQFLLPRETILPAYRLTG